MTTEEPKPDRLNAFSDGVFAVIITIVMLAQLGCCSLYERRPSSRKPAH